jgi:glycosyltransferase involved in cell wall biosynthesis
MENQPLISILMTAYNREQFISEAIKSVLASTYQNWELIIIDDSSIDSTVQIAERFAKSECRIKLVVNDINLGDYPNRNHAASFANGEYIVIVDSDDSMFSDTLFTWISLMKEYEASFGIFSHSQFKQPLLLRPSVIIPIHFFEEPILSFGPIATIIKTTYFKKIGGFTEKYGPANDMYYNLKAASQTDTLVFPFPLVNYRIHAGQELNNKYSYLFNNYLYLKDALIELDLGLVNKEIEYLSHKNKRRFVVNLLSYLTKTGKVKRAIYALTKSGFSIMDLADAIVNQPRLLRTHKQR